MILYLSKTYQLLFRYTQTLILVFLFLPSELLTVLFFSEKIIRAALVTAESRSQGFNENTSYCKKACGRCYT